MGIQRYMFFSIHNCEKHPEVPLMQMKTCTERYLAESGLNYTIFRLCGFMQVRFRLSWHVHTSMTHLSKSHAAQTLANLLQNKWYAYWCDERQCQMKSGINSQPVNASPSCCSSQHVMQTVLLVHVVLHRAGHHWQLRCAHSGRQASVGYQ